MQEAEMDSVGCEDRVSLLSVRARNCYKIWEIPPCSTVKTEEPKVRAMISGNIASASWSPDASYFALNSSTEGLLLCEVAESSGCSQPYTKFCLELPAHLKDLPPKQLKWMSFSPRGTYLITYYHASGHGLVDIQGPNYVVWLVKRGKDGRIASAEVVLAERYKNMMAPGPLQWRSDEAVRVLTSGGLVSVLEGHDFAAEPLLSFGFPGRFQLSIAPPRGGNEIILALFSPATENSKEPAELRFVFLDRSNASPVISASTSRCEFLGVDGCDISWAPSVERCLLMTSTLVDEAGENYGSVGDLWLCHVQPSKDAAALFPLPLTPNELTEAMKSNIKCPRLSTIKINRRLTQDASWSPVRDEFIVIEGKSPSDIYAMDGAEGTVLHTFPRGYRNKVLWNASGDMVAIGGFGNLAGDLSFYYRCSATEMILVSEIREGCTVLCGWSPCGNFFFTASVRPRMNVDNQIKIWSRNGNKIYHIPFDELYDVAWKNDDYHLFPSLPPPRASAAVVQKSMYRPRNSTTRDEQMLLVDKFLKGELKESELPEELRRSNLLTSRRNNRPANYNDKARVEQRKQVDLAMDWRVSPTASSSNLPNSDTQQPKPVPVAPPAAEPVPAAPVARPQDASLMALLQSILPSNARVHVREDLPPSPPPSYHQPQPASATAADQERFLQIMRQAGMLIPPPAKPRPDATRIPEPQRQQDKTKNTTQLWQYVDPKGNMQGPFTREQMRAWWEKGYFSGNLLVRCEGSSVSFRPLRELFPDASSVFVGEA